MKRFGLIAILALGLQMACTDSHAGDDCCAEGTNTTHCKSDSTGEKKCCNVKSREDMK